MSRSRIVAVAVAIGVVCSALTAAEPPGPRCIRPGTNARVVWHGNAAGTVRVYFHSGLAKTDHYIEMTPSAAGFWAVLPRPNADAVSVDYRVVTVDEHGAAVTREEGHMSLLSSCAATPLNVEEAKFAANLVIGSDVEGPAMPVGFRCDGIIGRITANELQAWNACAEEALSLAAARRTLVVVPPAQKVVMSKGSAAESLQGMGSKIGGLPIAPLHHRTPRRAPLPPTPPQPRLSEPVSPSRP